MESHEIVSLIETSLSHLHSEISWIFVAQVSVGIVVFYALKGIYLFGVLRVLGRYRKPMSRITGGGAKILIGGDSTAVGTGAADPSSTIFGFLSRDFPNTDIVNTGVNGALTRAIVDQLAHHRGETFDLIILSTGGNDVWAFTRLSRLAQDLRTVLAEAKHMSGHRVILLFFGNEGSAPFFPFFLRSIIMRRTEEVKRVFTEVALDEQVPLIELFSNPKENPFVRYPKRFFAPDGLHPNDRGYWEWYKHLWRLMVHKNYLYHERVDIEANR